MNCFEWSTDGPVTTPNMVDDRIYKLRGDRSAHGRKEPLKSSMLASRWERSVVKGKEAGEGFRCCYRLFLCCVRSSEYLPLWFAESGHVNSKCTDVTLDTLQISAWLGVMRTGKISREKGHDEDLPAVAGRETDWELTTLNSEVAVDPLTWTGSRSSRDVIPPTSYN